MSGRRLCCGMEVLGVFCCSAACPLWQYVPRRSAQAPPPPPPLGPVSLVGAVPVHSGQRFSRGPCRSFLR